MVLMFDTVITQVFGQRSRANGDVPLGRNVLQYVPLSGSPEETHLCIFYLVNFYFM